MYLNEKYMLYRIAYTLVNEEGYDILHINNEAEELWLEKYRGKLSTVIRLIHKGFDWKNHLKKDIQVVFHKLNQIKHLIVGKHITIHNIYISSHDPVDDWEQLKRPLKFTKDKSQTMHVYYFSHMNHFDDDLSRLQKNIDIKPIHFSFDLNEKEKEGYVDYYKKGLAKDFQHKRQKVVNVLSYGKPRWVYYLITVNVLMFLLLEATGGSMNTDNLIRFGAKFNPAMITGEWWRTISSMFLHIGIFHLFMNMFALYYLGIAVERIYGSLRFIVIYFLAGIGGSLASFAFSFKVSAGASGAIFGLFGALLFFGVIYKKVFFQTIGRGLITIVVINVVFGLIVPQIDMGAHLGGLIAGFLASAFVYLPKHKKAGTQLASIVLYILLSIGLVIFGTHQVKQHNNSDQMVYKDKSLESNKHNDLFIDHYRKY